MKSKASDYLEVMEAIYRDACIKCIADVFDLRDLITIRARVKQEGLSFLTITLPQFSKDFEKSLAAGVIEPKYFRSFRKYGVIPAFLRGMLVQMFNHETGRIYDITPKDASTIVESVRQVCLAFKKVEIDCTFARTAAALTGYVALEQSLTTFSVSEEEQHDFAAVSSVLWDSMFASVTLADLVPKHGPGATAEGISGNSKYNWQFWHDRIEPYFPLISTGYPLGVSQELEALDNVTMVPADCERPVRVVCVPKTLKSPRIIAIEPCCQQYVQQALRRVIYDIVEGDEITRGHVNFTDQSVNQKLALTSSLTGQLATIDLSDASDRVPHELALVMFRSNPDLRDAIDACRSTSAQLPDGSIVGPLKKFASMGSALCFPIEAMYFYTICVMALLRENNLPVTRRTCLEVSRDVHVYGDDIIVPQTNAIAVLEFLQKYNCKVNLDKTFLSGSFRESCGVDAFMGESVTPVYIRRERPENRQNAQELVSWTATMNQFYKNGYWRTASLMIQIIEKVIGPLPYLSDTSSGLSRFSYLGYRSATRWNGKYQRLEVKALVPSPVYRTDVLEGYGALVKCLLKAGEDESLDSLEPSWKLSGDTGRYIASVASVDKKHLERTARHGAVTLNSRWLPTQ